MRVDSYNKDQFVDLINESKNIAIIPSKVAGTDAYAASAGLYHLLKQKYDNKKVAFIHSGKIPDQCLGLVNPKDISSNLSQRDLVLSIDYSHTSAAKVSYSTDNNLFHLKLGPIPRDFDPARIKTAITGFDFDLIITLGAHNLVDLGPIYTNLRDEIEKAKIINVDNSSSNSRFGVVNVIDITSESLSALVYKNANQWGFIPNKSSAKALLTGMTYRNNAH